MKKSLFLVVALLMGVTTKAFPFACNETVEPNAGGPALCIESVYNNAGADLDVGDVVIWDVEQSTGDNDPWVTTTTTNDTYIVAGVVYPVTISAGTSGTIVVRGPVSTDVSTASSAGLNSVDGPACTSATAGGARSCAADAANFGFVTQASDGTNAIICVHCNK